MAPAAPRCRPRGRRAASPAHVAPRPPPPPPPGRPPPGPGCPWRWPRPPGWRARRTPQARAAGSRRTRRRATRARPVCERPPAHPPPAHRPGVRWGRGMRPWSRRGAAGSRPGGQVRRGQGRGRHRRCSPAGGGPRPASAPGRLRVGKKGGWVWRPGGGGSAGRAGRPGPAAGQSAHAPSTPPRHPTVPPSRHPRFAPGRHSSARARAICWSGAPRARGGRSAAAPGPSSDMAARSVRV